MIPVTETRTWNDFLTTTVADITPDIVQNAVDQHTGVGIFFGRLTEAMFGAAPEGQSRGKEGFVGESIEIRVNIGLSPNTQNMAGPYSNMLRNQSNTATITRANPKQMSDSVVISGRERRANRSEAQIVNLLGHKTGVAVSSLINRVASQLYDQGGDTTRMTGLTQLIAADDTLQNLSGSANQRWNSRGVTVGAKTALPGAISFTGGAFSVSGVQTWRQAWMNCMNGSMSPHVILTTDEIHTFYESVLVPGIRYNTIQLGNASFQALQFKTGSVLPDSFCTTGGSYLLNLDHTKAYVDAEADFTSTPIQKIDGKDAWAIDILLDANMGADMRHASNKVLSQTA